MPDQLLRRTVHGITFSVNTREAVKSSLAQTIGIWSVLAIALVLRVPMLDQSFWWDELWSTLPYATAESLWKTVGDLGYFFNNHVFYSILCRGSLFLFGESEYAARLPSLVMGLAGIFALYAAGSRLLEPPVGLIAAFFVAISPFHINHSTEARGYAALMLFSLLSSLLFIKALRKSNVGLWIWYGATTFLGFYSHIFMIAVLGTQCLCSLILASSAPLRERCRVPSQTLWSFLRTASITGVAVLIAYLPLLPDLWRNLHKVRLVAVDRLPFLTSLADTLLPGFASLPGAVLYVPLAAAGLTAVFMTDFLLFLYTVILLTVPLSAYLATNPMFIFERYFITLLPFVCMTISAGCMAIAHRLSGTNQTVYTGAAVLIFFVAVLHMPSLKLMLTQDRQNYRDAAYFVERTIASGNKHAAIMSVGHAGYHFQYYARRPVVMPKTFPEFVTLTEKTPCVWALITAWLPDLRPPYEDILIYAEDTEQTRIHDYIVAHWTLVKTFPAKMPTYVYCSAPPS